MRAGGDLNPDSPIYQNAAKLCAKKDGVPDLQASGTPPPGSIIETTSEPGGNGGLRQRLIQDVFCPRHLAVVSDLDYDLVEPPAELERRGVLVADGAERIPADRDADCVDVHPQRLGQLDPSDGVPSIRSVPTPRSGPVLVNRTRRTGGGRPAPGMLDRTT